MLHRFVNIAISQKELPTQFTYPFHYTPPPLCVAAAKEVQAYLATREDWKEELEKGKMFGVLIVQTPDGETGFLAAFSGILAGRNVHPYFVPPVYDLLQPDGFFKKEEENISAINAEIHRLETDNEYILCLQTAEAATKQAEQAITEAKASLKAAKAEREQRRKNNPDEAELAQMIRESQYQKAELKRTERLWKDRLSALQEQVSTFTTRIEALKAERKMRSAALQQKLFGQFKMLNARGEIKDLCDIFSHTVQKTPPAGAGECAAPKLLQHAYLKGWKPIAMAEFWWGASPKTEIRHHGYYYPACKGKCEPILAHMLQGLDVEPNPLSANADKCIEPEIIYEDEWLLAVNKPEGMLSVPGKEAAGSVAEWAKQKYPTATGPMIVHRLDMATSGLLLIAKTKEVHQNLQAQFKNRTVKKRYIALLERSIVPETGTISLPLCLNPLDRPRQIADKVHGKPAITEYRVLSHAGNMTRIAFYPLTGRTHQLRVHAAHAEGLNAPIKGDTLYGKESDRLYLHAEAITFRHPVTGKTITVEKEAGF